MYPLNSSNRRGAEDAEITQRDLKRSSVRVRPGRSLRYCERHCLGLSGEGLMVGVHQLEPHLVRAGRQPRYVDRIVVARVRPPPRS